jgi:hypothetical protein
LYFIAYHSDHYGSLENIVQTYILYESFYALAISSGEAYNAYEKFLLPFDPSTWICCGIIFGGALFVIVFINATGNIKLKRIIFGKQVKRPAFNILVAFFGQSQNVLPSRSSARYFLMLFIIFCFFIRCGYQGVQFDMIFMVSFYEFIII